MCKYKLKGCLLVKKKYNYTKLVLVDVTWCCPNYQSLVWAA